jgi:hypothetical protein
MKRSSKSGEGQTKAAPTGAEKQMRLPNQAAPVRRVANEAGPFGLTSSLRRYDQIWWMLRTQPPR